MNILQLSRKVKHPAILAGGKGGWAGRVGGKGGRVGYSFCLKRRSIDEESAFMPSTTTSRTTAVA